MGIEIERKFLVVGDAWRQQSERQVRMVQGYLSDPGAIGTGRPLVSVRVRVAGDEAELNLKSVTLGHTRQEFSYPIPLADAVALLRLCVGGRIDKVRHYLHHDGWLWEVDEFEGDNRGLVVAEIELEAADASFSKPAWVGAEVTDEPRYYNVALALRPYSQWREEEAQGC